MILNHNLDWSIVGSIPTGPGTFVRDAFQLQYGQPTRELLPAGTSIYKFNGYPTLGRGEITDETTLSPWWSPTDPFQHDAGLEQKKKIAQRNGVSLREWGRLTSVIKENWSSLDYLLEMRLKSPVYAWFGGFKGMDRIDTGSQSKRNTALEMRGNSQGLPGGATQFYIPNLTVGHFMSHKFSKM
ncbi:hypothetical protein A152_0009260 [Vibrio tasmaniensis 1F-187]|uniref:hypothetical protein n=1 Tax=Vibrio TaxID=662 RepID=UPI00030690FD|nr:hypothetical protein [Vibrio tasmaniensis]OEF68855.1 hypothetical protein A152_03510 [Vibrio tasmaniensis 1F-187]